MRALGKGTIRHARRPPAHPRGHRCPPGQRRPKRRRYHVGTAPVPAGRATELGIELIGLIPSKPGRFAAQRARTA